jgi:hypothetical protein
MAGEGALWLFRFNFPTTNPKETSYLFGSKNVSHIVPVNNS